MISIRFQADADLNQTILLAAIRREPGLDFQTAHQCGLISIADADVLARASDEDRILVTHDQRTMPSHFAEFIKRRESPGLLIVRQSLPVAQVVDDLLLIHAVTQPEEWINRIAFLPL
jgi:predicted nuclease of predicted toxin-antitoxin system